MAFGPYTAAGTGAAFDRAAGEWLIWQRTPWARVYYALVQHVLGAVVDHSRPLDVLDVGGANGVDSRPLLAAGHRVTILDSSRMLLAEAQAALASDDPARDRLRAEWHDLDDGRPLPVRAGSAGWDVVLCHNVLHYRRDPAELVGRLLAALRPGGVLSLIAPNPAMDVLAAAIRDRDPGRGLELLSAATRDSVTVGVPMRRLESAVVEAAVRAAGATVTARYGLRAVIDLVSDEELKRDASWLDRTLELERALCALPPYCDIARFWQLIVQRPVSTDKHSVYDYQV